MDSKFAGEPRANMKITVHADDGYSASVVVSENTTAAQVVDSFVKLRTLTQASTTHPDSQDCLLTYANKGTPALSLGEDVIVAKALKGFPHGGRLVCLGYKTQQRYSALNDIYEFASRMTLARAVLAKSLATMNETDDTTAGQNVIREDIQAKTESYLAEVHRVLDTAIASGGTEAATFAAAKDALSAGDVVKMIGILNLPHVFTVPSSSGNDASSSSSRPATATKAKAPAKGKAAAGVNTTAPALPVQPQAAPATTTDSAGKPLSKAALARAKKAAAAAAAQSAADAAVDSDNGAPSEQTSLVPPVVKKNTKAAPQPAAQIAVPVPTTTAAPASQEDGSSSSSESSSSGSSSSGSDSESDSDSDSEAEEMDVAASNPQPVSAVEQNGAAKQQQQQQQAVDTSLTRNRSGSESSVSSSGSSSSSTSSGSSSSGSDSDEEMEQDATVTGTGTAATTATVSGTGEMDVEEPAAATSTGRGAVSRDIETQMLTQASQPDDADQEDGFNAESYLRGAHAQAHSPLLLASPNGGVQMTGTQVDDDDQDEVSPIVPLGKGPVSQAATATGTGYESDSESSSGSSSSGSDSGSESSSSDSESSDSDSDAGSVGEARRLVQPTAPTTVAKTPSALTSLLIRPSAMKPASSYLPPAQQKEASQTLELERQLFPKLAPTTADQGSDSDSGDLSSASSDSEGSGSDSDDDTADGADGADRQESDSEAEKVIFAPVETKKNARTPKTAKKEPRQKPATGASNSAPTSPAGEIVKRKAGRPKGSGGLVAPGTAPAKAGGAGRGSGAGRGGRGDGRGGVTSPEGGRGAGRGGRGAGGATSKRRDIDPSLLKSMIAGTTTVSATSSEPVPSTGASAATASADATAATAGLTSPAEKKKRKTATAPEQSTPAVASPQSKKAKKAVPSASP